MGFLDSMFGGGESSVDNSGAFADFARQMRERMPAYDPWINAGNQARDTSMGEYNKLVQNPNFLQDMVAGGFYESPYQKYMQDMVSKKMNYNATNTGMLGSGAANRALQQELTNMTGGFMNDYINRGMGSYGQGLSGLGGMTELGYKALGDQTGLFEQGAAGDLQGQLSRNAYDAAQEANQGNFWGNIVGTGLGIAGGAFGGPAGAMAGSSLGNMFGGGKGGNAGSSIGSWFGQNPQAVTDWGATGGRMPQFDFGNFNTGNLSY